jgi:hypothetical protein
VESLNMTIPSSPQRPGGRRTNRTWWILIGAAIVVALLIWIGVGLTHAGNPALTPGGQDDATTQTH